MKPAGNGNFCTVMNAVPVLTLSSARTGIDVAPRQHSISNAAAAVWCCCGVCIITNPVFDSWVRRNPRLFIEDVAGKAANGCCNRQLQSDLQLCCSVDATNESAVACQLRVRLAQHRRARCMTQNIAFRRALSIDTAFRIGTQLHFGFPGHDDVVVSADPTDRREAHSGSIASAVRPDCQPPVPKD